MQSRRHFLAHHDDIAWHLLLIIAPARVNNAAACGARENGGRQAEEKQK